MGKRLLVIDDDPTSRRLMKAIFHAEGLEVVEAEDGATGIEKARGVGDESVSAILLDMHLPDTLGLDVLATLSSTRETASIPIVMLTADRELKSAIRATQLGALDYLTKPVDHDEVVSVVRRALETHSLRCEVEDLRRQLGEGGGLLAQMGSSQEARAVAEHVKVVAASRFTVLILGETGTGKELVAQAIHRQSDRRDKPFVALDCGAIPEALLESELFGHERGAFTGAHRSKAGRFELANGGTLFLDEVGNLPMSLQVKLLRALESKQILAVGSTKVRSTDLDVRFIAATNDDLEQRASRGIFRADLYFRLAQYTIPLPPLRERPSDIRFLANKFVEEVGIELRKPVLSVAEDAIKLLERQPWPGNVRELRNVVRQAVLRSGDLTIRKEIIKTLLAPTPAKSSSASSMSSASSASSMSSSASAAPLDPSLSKGLPASLKEIAMEAARHAERQAICEMLRETKGNKSHAARALRTDYKTLHLKMKALGIRARDFE